MELRRLLYQRLKCTVVAIATRNPPLSLEMMFLSLRVREQNAGLMTCTTLVLLLRALEAECMLPGV